VHRRLKGFVFMDGTIKIKLYRSPISTPQKHKRVVLGLGLRKLNQIVVRPDSPVFRGMVNKVPHLLKLVD
jgi:large subunit ribosomal protein L30